MSDTQTDAPEQTDGAEAKQEHTFTQADVDKIVRERVQRERAKYADYDDLKSKAGEKASADERITALEAEVVASKREALRRRVQAAHALADEDAELFLTGTDEETLTAQAKRLADRDSERKRSNNVVPSEGANPNPGNADDEVRQFTRRVFGDA